MLWLPGYTPGNSQHHRNSFSQSEPHFYDAVVVGICDVYLQTETSIICGIASPFLNVALNSNLYRAKVRPTSAVPGHSHHLQNGSSTLEMTLNLVPAYSFTAIQLSSI